MAVAQQNLQHLIDGLAADEAARLQEIVSAVAQMTATVNEIRRLAQRESHFIAVSAHIEASRVARGGTSLTAVALDIRKVSQELPELMNAAHERIAKWNSDRARLTQAA